MKTLVPSVEILQSKHFYLLSIHCYRSTKLTFLDIAMYINFMIQVKHYVDVKKTEKSVADARVELLNFYKKLSNAKSFEHVDITCFKERSSHEMKQDETVEKTQKKEMSD